MAKALEKELKSGDVLLTMGAGQAYKCADLYLLEEKKDKI
jgi:UDP-N-acetylmuramate-alanine ligase